MPSNLLILPLNGISKTRRFSICSNLSGGATLRTKINIVLFALIFCLPINENKAQDLNYARKIVSKLSSEKLQGRGYINNGDLKAAKFLRIELERLGIKPLTKNYFQNYLFPVNTFPGTVKLKIDGKTLIPGKDFIVKPTASSVYGTFEIIKYDTLDFSSSNTNFKNKFALLDTLGWGKKWYKFAINNKKETPYRGILQLAYKMPSTSISLTQLNNTSFLVSKETCPENPTTVTAEIEAKEITHSANNVLGMIEGEVDTFILFTAHYDHLGKMGKKAMFPGANDNASGTSMVLDFAQTIIKQTKRKYSYAFMFFSGEEAGLLGSEYYASHPIFPLNKIKIVINLDMVGTGIDGISVFNATSHPKEFSILDSINRQMNLGLNLKQRGPSQGSDHFSFHKRGVKALFFLTDDKNAPYHTTTDTYNSLSFEAYEKLFKLIYSYINQM